MNLSEKCKAHVDSCRFCWMCHHICPVGNATGQERSTPRGRALGISLVRREAIALEEIMDNVYECALCGACVHDCTTGWDPVMFTKETRLAAALEGKTPAYIMSLVENCLSVGNAYGKKDVCPTLAEAIKSHTGATDTLLYLGADARYVACTQAVKAIRVLEKAGVAFTVLADEACAGTQLDFLIGAANETREAMVGAAKQMDAFKTVVFYDPADAKLYKQTAKEYGVETKASLVTYTAYLAALVDEGKLAAKKGEKTVVFQDPFQLARDLEETEEARRVVSAFAELHEMHLNRGETVWAGGPLMAEYMPATIRLIAKRRILGAKSLGETVIVTASPAEYLSLKAVAEDVEILSLEDLILA